ncbi:GTP 3',8-cyclase MoaA [Siphonobacter sp.]|uniref:GTP 3',8-cyclase MoaA n=1 Tax=Siphonobacter sp. TaxID=1869184 RepID=UPI003B3ABFDD
MPIDRPQIYDNHGRPIQYLRLAVTDRCNLRCFYCMPEEGIAYLPKKQLLTYEEMLRITSVLAGLGVRKVRITGGEPFVRHQLPNFLYQLAAIEGIDEIAITTNGVLTQKYIPDLKKIGVKTINLSLDSLDRQRFYEITRRDEFLKVEACLYELLDAGFEVKLNAVVMEGRNIEDLIPLARLTEKYPVSVRFIEEMPFNGEGSHYPTLHWTYRRILEHLQTEFPDIQKQIDPLNSTAYHYQIPGFLGNIGIIAAFSRTFCGTCNRIRMTAQGTLKTCLYDDGVLNVRDLIRSGISDEALQQEFIRVFQKRPKDGYEAENNRQSLVHESMTTIGG